MGVSKNLKLKNGGRTLPSALSLSLALLVVPLPVVVVGVPVVVVMVKRGGRTCPRRFPSRHLLLLLLLLPLMYYRWDKRYNNTK